MRRRSATRGSRHAASSRFARQADQNEWRSKVAAGSRRRHGHARVLRWLTARQYCADFNAPPAEERRHVALSIGCGSPTQVDDLELASPTEGGRGWDGRRLYRVRPREFEHDAGVHLGVHRKPVRNHRHEPDSCPCGDSSPRAPCAQRGIGLSGQRRPPGDTAARVRNSAPSPPERSPSLATTDATQGNEGTTATRRNAREARKGSLPLPFRRGDVSLRAPQRQSLSRTIIRLRRQIILPRPAPTH